MSKYIKTLLVYFDLKISNKEIVLFRGAILDAMNRQGNILFHNHIDDKIFRYSYPLIQYKEKRGFARIVCIQKGTEVIAELLQLSPISLHIGEREVETHIKKIVPHRIFVQTWKTTFNYKIKNWIPLNSENYQKYNATTSLLEQIQLLEQILKGNLLSFCKGIEVYIEEEIEVKITKLSQPHIMTNKGIKLMTFDIDFSSNLSIPDNIGIGKNASIGFGVITKIKHENNNNKYEQ